MSKESSHICCLKIKAESCIASIGYQISVKEKAGYCVDAMYEKMRYVSSLLSMIEDKMILDGAKVVGNEIIFCGEKVLLSENNSLFLTNVDSCERREEELTEECCIDICEIESKLKEVCSNC